MTIRKIALPIVLTAFILILIPAAMAAGGTISGKVAFPANTTLTMDLNQTVDATSLTIYAMNTNTNFVNVTSPKSDGTYSVHVPQNGIYRIFLSPSEVIDATNYSYLRLAQYPDMGERVYLIMVNGDTDNVDINYYPPKGYVPPNNLTLGTPSSTPTATPKPTPGFAAVLAAIGLIGALAVVSRRK